MVSKPSNYLRADMADSGSGSGSITSGATGGTRMGASIGSTYQKDPYYLHPSDTSGVQLVPTQLTEDLYEAYMFTPTAQEVWKELEEKYGKTNRPQLVHVKKQLATLERGNDSLAVYSTKLKKLWEEVCSLQPKPQCTCDCEASKLLEDLHNSNYVDQFLMGLGDAYESVVSNILLMEPVPSYNKVYSMVAQIESQRSVTLKNVANVEASALLAKANDMQKYTASVSRSFDRKKEKASRFCTHCNRTGHLEDVCFKKIGYPDWFMELKNQKGKKQSNSVNATFDDDSTGSKQKVVDEDKKSLAEMIQEELRKMMAGKGGTTSTSAQAASLNASYFADFAGNQSSSHIDYFSNSANVRWIIDSGASSHVTSSLELLTEISRPMGENTVQLPNGLIKKVEFVGKAILNTAITLENVLFVPEFKYNLVAVSKLATGLNLDVVFHDTGCVMQDRLTKKQLAKGKMIKNLYVLVDAESADLKNNTSLTCNSIDCIDSTLWHERLGHPSHNVLGRIDAISPKGDLGVCWKTPYAVLNNKVPGYDLLRVFEYLCYATNIDPKRKKFDQRAKKCIFLGIVHGVKGFKVYDLAEKKVFVNRNVKFYEKIFPFEKGKQVLSEPLSSLPNMSTYFFDDDQVSYSKSPILEEAVEQELPTSSLNADSSVTDGDLRVVGSDSDVVVRPTSRGHVPSSNLRTSSRDKKQPGWLKDYVTCSVVNSSDHTPLTYPFVKSTCFSKAYEDFLANISIVKEPSTRSSEQRNLTRIPFLQAQHEITPYVHSIMRRSNGPRFPPQLSLHDQLHAHRPERLVRCEPARHLGGHRHGGPSHHRRQRHGAVLLQVQRRQHHLRRDGLVPVRHEDREGVEVDRHAPVGVADEDGELHVGGHERRRGGVEAVHGGADHHDVGLGGPVDQPEDEDQEGQEEDDGEYAGAESPPGVLLGLVEAGAHAHAHARAHGLIHGLFRGIGAVMNGLVNGCVICALWRVIFFH
ncbi:Retrovirus-related Pol polyprotein from transposon RE1 [Senna tora]|uniref:Retrovirus-related Pol polyprotein from transposon RE1 n=1 Tax=Senna tora TaxID=362788 RepID=A0A834XG46_9FABA|nr:Retrovirus-related Pol polyprotein from transposon RE1 [Senna tora]